MFRLSLCALVSALLAAPVSAGTVTVDFTMSPDFTIQAPDFMTWQGATRGGKLHNGYAIKHVSGYTIGLTLDAGDAPISFTAIVGAVGTIVSPGCDVSMITQPHQQITCASETGYLPVEFRAPDVDLDPPWTFVPPLNLDDLVITGDDVSQVNMVSRFANTPEPSSLALIAIAGIALAVLRRMRLPSVPPSAPRARLRSA